MLDEAEFKLLDGNFAKPNLDESLDRATRTNPDDVAESRDIPVSSDVYTNNKPEIERQRLLSDINAPALKESHPKTSKWLTDGKNSAVAIDDLDVLKGMEGVLRDKKKGFFGLRYDDLRRGFANLQRTGRYTSAIEYMNAAQDMAFIDEHDITSQDEMLAKTKEIDQPRFVNHPLAVMYLNAGSEERESIKKRTQNSFVENIGKVAAHTREAAAIPRSVEGEKFAKAKSFSEAWSVFTESPLEVAAGVTTESLAQFAPAIPFMAAGAPVAALGVGITSFSGEYVGDVIGSMQEAGIKIDDREQLIEALSDPERLKEWEAHALKRGIPIAVIDAISMGVAGKLVEVAKTPVKKALAGAGEALAVQPALGGLGEIAGTVVAGDEISGQAVLAEMLGEIIPGAIETTAGVYQQASERAEAKAIEQTLVAIGEQKIIDDIVSYAQSSTTRGRAPEQFEDFVNNLGENREVLIPTEIASQLENAPEYIAEQLNILGTNISVPLNKFASEIAPNEDWMAIIRPHIKLSENTLTQNDLDTGDRGELQALLKKAQESQETLTEADQVYETVKDQIKATGLQGEATARYSAQIYPAAATVYVEKAKKLGHDISVSEVFEMMGFKVEAAAVDAEIEAGVIVDQVRKVAIPPDIEITMDREVIETGETVQETFNAKELSDEIDTKIDSYKQLRDCLG